MKIFLIAIPRETSSDSLILFFDFMLWFLEIGLSGRIPIVE